MNESDQISSALETRTSEHHTIRCGDCQTEFDFTAGEQRFFASHALMPPKRCETCRSKRKLGPLFNMPDYDDAFLSLALLQPFLELEPERLEWVLRTLDQKLRSDGIADDTCDKIDEILRSFVADIKQFERRTRELEEEARDRWATVLGPVLTAAKNRP